MRIRGSALVQEGAVPGSSSARRRERLHCRELAADFLDAFFRARRERRSRSAALETGELDRRLQSRDALNARHQLREQREPSLQLTGFVMPARAVMLQQRDSDVGNDALNSENGPARADAQR